MIHCEKVDKYLHSDRYRVFQKYQEDDAALQPVFEEIDRQATCLFNQGHPLGEVVAVVSRDLMGDSEAVGFRATHYEGHIPLMVCDSINGFVGLVRPNSCAWRITIDHYAKKEKQKAKARLTYARRACRICRRRAGRIRRCSSLDSRAGLTPKEIRSHAPRSEPAGRPDD